MKAILNMTSPKTVKEVQELTGRTATLNKFVFKAMDKCLPFFKTLKQAFAWTNECKVAFQELKHYLSNLPLLSPSTERENLYLYLAVSTIAVSAALIQEGARRSSQFITSVKLSKVLRPSTQGLKRLHLR